MLKKIISIKFPYLNYQRNDCKNLISKSDTVKLFKKVDEFCVYATHGKRNLLVIYNFKNKCLSSWLVIVNILIQQKLFFNFKFVRQSNYKPILYSYFSLSSFFLLFIHKKPLS